MRETVEATLPQLSERKRRPDRLGELVTHLEKEGADFSKIARLMGENPATVRYWFRNKLIKKGFTLQAAANHRAIGLRRIVATVRLSGDYAPIALRVFEELSESAFLVGEQARIDGTHVMFASVPIEMVEQYRLFLLDLKSIGFLSEIVDVRAYDWFRILPMKVEHYDFGSDSWELDFAKRIPKAEVKIPPSKLKKFDKTDLLIVRRLQVDSSVSVRQIAKRLNMNYKKVLRHHKHVITRKLVPFHCANWMRTGYDPRTKKAHTPRHVMLPIHLEVKDVQGAELEKLMLEVHRLPFVWAENGGPGYFAYIYLPLNLANEVLHYLHEITSDYYGLAHVWVVDMNDAFTYTIIPELYDQRAHRWTFNPEATLDKIKSLLPVATA